MKTKKRFCDRMQVIMRGLVLLPAILMLSGLALGQEAAKDEKAKDGKEMAVAYMLGEPDRLMSRLSEENTRLSAMRKGALDSREIDATRAIYPVEVWPAGVYHFANENAKASCIAGCEKRLSDLEKELEGLRTGDIPIPELSPFESHIGEAGIIKLPLCEGFPPAVIFQIVDKSQMLVNVKRQSYTPEYHIENKMFLLKTPTEGRADNEKLPLDFCVAVSGTHQYTTVNGGSHTVFVLEKIDPEWLRAEVKKRMPSSTIDRVADVLAKTKADRKAEANKKAAEEKAEADRKAAAAKATAEKKAAEEKAEADRQAAIEEAKWHTWTDSTGEFKTKAMFGGMAGGKVKLIKKDGSTVQMPLEKLSDEDRRWIKSKSHRVSVEFPLERRNHGKRIQDDRNRAAY